MVENMERVEKYILRNIRKKNYWYDGEGAGAKNQYQLKSGEWSEDLKDKIKIYIYQSWLDIPRKRNIKKVSKVSEVSVEINGQTIEWNRSEQKLIVPKRRQGTNAKQKVKNAKKKSWTNMDDILKILKHLIKQIIEFQSQLEY